jgi:glucokinase
MKVLAVDIGGTHVSCGAVEDHNLLESVSIDTDHRNRLADLLPVLEGTLSSLAERHPGDYAGIGFGFCGLVNANTGTVLATNGKFSDATTIDLPGWARAAFDLPLALENDTRLALLGEHHAGSARESDDVVMMTLGTGIGSAVISERRLLRGKHFQAGCLGGHFTVALHGRLCSCGARGCFEAEASTGALSDICSNWPGFKTSALAQTGRLDFHTLFACADRGDGVAVEIRDRCIAVWSACALSLVHAYDPELFVLGGGVMKSSYPILEALRQHVDGEAWTPWGKVQFRQAALGTNAALLGALPLIAQHDEIHLR